MDIEFKQWRIKKMSSEFFRFEDTEYDIPFYKENPSLTTSKISVLILGIIIVFISPFVIPIEGYDIPKALIICLATLIPVTYALNGKLSMIFRIPKARDIILIILGIIGVFALNILMGIILNSMGIVSTTDSAINNNATLMFITLIIQLMGEELFKFILLVLVLYATYKSLGRKVAILLGIIVSQLLFSLLHIPAYGFNLPQLLLSLGVAWSVLPVIYVKTKNIVVVYIIHLLLDLMGFVSMFG